MGRSARVGCQGRVVSSCEPRAREIGDERARQAFSRQKTKESKRQTERLKGASHSAECRLFSV